MSQAQLYISKRCPYCRRLLMEIHKRDHLKGHIKIISIDNSSYPSTIKKVPTMIVNKEHWDLNQIIEFLMQQDSQKNTQAPQQASQQAPQQASQNDTEEELPGFCEGGSCLSFSSIDGSVGGIEGESQFSFIDGDSSQNIQVSDKGDPGFSSKNERISQFDSDYEKMMSERGDMMPGRAPIR